jgi:hypothetical protein
MLMSMEVVLCVTGAIMYTRADLLWFPVQNLGVLAAPFLITTQYTLPAFLFNIEAKYLSHIAWAFLTYETKNDFFSISIAIGFIHLVAVYSLLFIQYPTIVAQGLQEDPLFPYAISREILYSKVLDVVPQSPTGTTEGGETGASGGDTASPQTGSSQAGEVGGNRGSGSNRRKHRRKVN